MYLVTLKWLFEIHNYFYGKNIVVNVIVYCSTIVFVRYILLEWIRRNENDERSYGEIFYMFCDDIQDMQLTNALQSLMTLFVNITQTFSSAITELIKNQVSNWMTSQACFIQAMFSDLCWESWNITFEEVDKSIYSSDINDRLNDTVIIGMGVVE